MKDNMKTCEHTLSRDVEYKEVVIIGNGPSGMVTSFMLAGNVPYLKDVPEDLPIDEMLKARLSNLPPGQSLYETDLMELAEGLEGRSQNPIPLLMDTLMRPCADLGLQAEPLIEWRHDADKEVEHIVLGRGPPGGAWHTFPATVRTLSPAAWLTLPPHPPAGGGRLSARAVAKYCRRYVTACGLQKYFRSGVIVSAVTRVPASARMGARCHTRCPLNANYCVSGYDVSDGRRFSYYCSRVVIACGSGGKPNSLPTTVPHAVHSLAAVERALHTLGAQAASPTPPSVLIIGSGVSAADAVWLTLKAGLNARHVHRTPADALARLDPTAYPDYCQVYKMMCDGPSAKHHNYTPYPEHTVLEVTPATQNMAEDHEEIAITPKRVKLLNTATNEITEIIVSLIAVFIGSKPDLFFLQTNYLNCINDISCQKCLNQQLAKRKLEEKQCFLKNHWHYLKIMLGQSIQICKSRYMNTDINGNDGKCVLPDCNKFDNKLIENVAYEKCICDVSLLSSGIGFGLDPNKPVDGRSNPIAVDKNTHEILNGPGGMYALGPLTADNFVRFIPGGALAIAAHLHKK